MKCCKCKQWLTNYQKCVTLILITLLLLCAAPFIWNYWSSPELVSFSISNIHNQYITITEENSSNIIIQACYAYTIGFGNILSQYWAARSIAFWNNISFESTRWKDINKCKNKHIQSYLTSSKYFLKELPKRISAINESYLLYSYPNIFLSDPYKFYFNSCVRTYSHNCDLLLFYYNKYYNHIVYNSTINAIQKHGKRKSDPEINKLENADIVIHMRCGDILTVGPNFYKFFTYNYYKHAIMYTTDHYYDNNIFDSNNYTIWILSQLNAASQHNKKDRENSDICSKFILNLLDKFKQNGINDNSKLFNNYYVLGTHLHDHNDLINDFSRMIESPLLICDTSTFCLHGAIAHNPIKGRVVIPLNGAWHLDNAIKLSLLPTNHYVIDDDLMDNWSILASDVVKYGWNDDKNIDKLIDYLAMH